MGVLRVVRVRVVGAGDDLGRRMVAGLPSIGPIGWPVNARVGGDRVLEAVFTNDADDAVLMSVLRRLSPGAVWGIHPVPVAVSA